MGSLSPVSDACRPHRSHTPVAPRHIRERTVAVPTRPDDQNKTYKCVLQCWVRHQKITPHALSRPKPALASLLPVVQPHVMPAPLPIPHITAACAASAPHR